MFARKKKWSTAIERETPWTRLRAGLSQDGAVLREQVGQVLVAGEPRLSARILSLCEALLDLADTPLGRALVSVAALMGAWTLL